MAWQQLSLERQLRLLLMLAPQHLLELERLLQLSLQQSHPLRLQTIQLLQLLLAELQFKFLQSE